MKVDLHLIAWGRPKMTELTIRTIRRNTKRENYNLYVFNNYFDKASEDLVRHMDAQGMIDGYAVSPENIGLEAARNAMLNQFTENKYFICIDNDCLPPPILNGKDWIERLVELMERWEDMAAISARNPIMIGTGNIFEFADKAGDDIVEFPHPGGSLRIMRTDVTKAVGGWDREAPGRGSEETFICGKLRDAGFMTAFATKIHCLHLFGTREAHNFTDRWGYDKAMTPEDSGHRDIDHPALRNGDDIAEIIKFAGEELAHDYSNN